MALDALDELSTHMKEEPHSTRHDTIVLHNRTGRSVYTRIIHFIVRRLRDYLGKPKKHQPRGCSNLKPHRIIKRTCKVSERQVEGVFLYDIFPKHLRNRQNLNKRIYYFCGGGWQSPPSSQHWQLCSRFASHLPDTSVTIVSYPLAPNNPAPESFPRLMRLYRTLMQQAAEAGDKVILAGDSSGGNIVLCLALEALREDEERTDISEVEKLRIPHPTAIMAISPSTDLTRSNPDIEKLKEHDPILTPPFIKATAAAWKGDWDAEDPRLSPINADISLLAKHNINVHGVTGGYDILGPDAMLFRDKLAEEGVHGEWLNWEEQMHCFVLTWPYGVPEGREGVGWMIDILKNE